MGGVSSIKLLMSINIKKRFLYLLTWMLFG